MWIVGDGKNIDLWTSKWVDNLVLSDYIQEVPKDMVNLKVANIIDYRTRDWKLQKVSFFPEFVLQNIIATPIPYVKKKKKDSSKCASTKNGISQLNLCPLQYITGIIPNIHY